MLRTVTAAKDIAPVVTLDEAKAHLRVDHGDDDLLIAALVTAATIAAQDLTQRRFAEQVVEWPLMHWHCGWIALPIAPVTMDDVEFDRICRRCRRDANPR
ncbi:head-tail connector protein [Bradyrhizobium sp. BR 1433]|uniref:head-tail connector protein n=1 Tax=Bradyrhizobium sp. BR 1433 TaxID=3447967 RepID=UPI003EE69996